MDSMHAVPHPLSDAAAEARWPLRAARWRAPAPVGATGVCLVTLGFSAAFAAVSGVGDTTAVDGHGTSVVVAVIGGLLLGLPLAAQALHAQLARPLGGFDGAVGSRYVYAPGARRRMAIGLGIAYATAAALSTLLVASTGAGGALRAALAY